MKDFEQLFEEVAEQIDWGKIERTMKSLEWTWHNQEINTYSLIKTAKNRCMDAYKGGTGNNSMYESASGGFHAFYNPEYNELSLYFVVSSGFSNDYDEQ